jgi:hypothetical protein
VSEIDTASDTRQTLHTEYADIYRKLFPVGSAIFPNDGEAHHRPGKEMTRMKNKAQQDRHSSIDAPRVNMLPAGLLPFARQKLPGFCAA